jgi:GDP-L-fucose synthase
MNFWTQQRVVVTGGAGFLGYYVVQGLMARGCTQIVVPRRRECDLRDRGNIAKLFADSRPTLVIHLAAAVAGVGANRAHPGRFFYDNAIMGIELLEQARLHNIPKVVVTGTVCAYPKHAPLPCKEDDLWNGYPDESNAPYALAKQALLVQCQAYRKEYGLNSIFLLPVNLYGPRDHFDTENAHVIPALIRRCAQARENNAATVDCWGTGRATREFLYVADCAEGILLAAERYDKPDPVNLGSGIETSIKELTKTIAHLTRFTGEIRWDTTKPDGQPRCCFDTSRAEKEFGFRATTPFETGLRETIAWYEQHRA